MIARSASAMMTSQKLSTNHGYPRKGNLADGADQAIDVVLRRVEGNRDADAAGGSGHECGALDDVPLQERLGQLGRRHAGHAEGDDASRGLLGIRRGDLNSPDLAEVAPQVVDQLLNVAFDFGDANRFKEFERAPEREELDPGTRGELEPLGVGSLFVAPGRK